ncbi:MAG: PqqD family protein [Prevotella sp.]|nr:PqqD family protein [Prevotella sp.]MBQ9652023.1 PqqD family protein [Prevotella sp.]
MKTKKGFKIRTICGEHVVVAEGIENIDFSKIISMNETSAYLWEKVQGEKTFTEDSLTALLLEEYEVDEETAKKDVHALVAQWLEAGIIEA